MCPVSRVHFRTRHNLCEDRGKGELQVGDGHGHCLDEKVLSTESEVHGKAGGILGVIGQAIGQRFVQCHVELVVSLGRLQATTQETAKLVPETRVVGYIHGEVTERRVLVDTDVRGASVLCHGV